MLEKMWRNRNTFILLVGEQISSTIVEDSVAIPQRPKDRNTIRHSNSITGYIYAKEYKSSYYEDTCMAMFIATLFTIAKTWNQPKCPSVMTKQNVAPT